MENEVATINVGDFWKADIRIGTVVAAESVPGSEKLLKLEVDLGGCGKRQILTGMAKWYKPEELVGLKTAFLLNIPARKMMGLESHGMILGTDTEEDGKPVFLVPKDEVANGAKVI